MIVKNLDGKPLQIEANRLNAKFSTGPKTSEGREVIEGRCERIRAGLKIVTTELQGVQETLKE